MGEHDPSEMDRRNEQKHTKHTRHKKGAIIYVKSVFPHRVVGGA
jgi:hypothetical protein